MNMTNTLCMVLFPAALDKVEEAVGVLDALLVALVKTTVPAVVWVVNHSSLLRVVVVCESGVE